MSVIISEVCCVDSSTGVKQYLSIKDDSKHLENRLLMVLMTLDQRLKWLSMIYDVTAVITEAL